MDRLLHAVNRLDHAIKHARKMMIKRENKATGPGFVYIIGCHGYVKVGIAKNVAVRVCGLQVGCPYELKLLLSFPTNHMERDERRIHEMWKRYEVRGEWFSIPPGELAFAMNAKTIDELLG
jgi:hypothetical protein